MTFAAHLEAAAVALDRHLADRYGSTVITVDCGAPAPLDLPEVSASGSISPAWARIEVTPAMVAVVDAYLAAKPEHERAELAALMEAA